MSAAAGDGPVGDGGGQVPMVEVPASRLALIALALRYFAGVGKSHAAIQAREYAADIEQRLDERGDR